MTTVAISQPMYFPWVGFMNLMAAADVFIWLDDAQYSKGSFTNRIQVRTARGSTWMTIPLEGKGKFQQIRELRAADDSWRSSHRALLTNELATAPSLGEALSIFDSATSHDSLVETLIASSELLNSRCGRMPARILRASEMGVAGTASERVLGLIQAAGGDSYVTAHGAANYLDHDLFENAGVKVRYMSYAVDPWPQQHPGFSPYVTFLDAIAFLGERAGDYVTTTSVDWQLFMSRRPDTQRHA